MIGEEYIMTGESPAILQKLSGSTKFLHQKMRWNYAILRSVIYQ